MVYKLPEPTLSKTLPTEHDLPDTDNQPVDNELQIFIPGLLRAILLIAWADRPDWFVGVNIGLYYEPNRPAVGPDAFLSLGAPRARPGKDLRLSYVLWEERVMPTWVLEIVSQKPGGEYDRKMKLYAELGILYYTIYNPKHYKRDKHDSFEMYRLIEGEYVRQQGNPIWMPEVGLGIGVDSGVHYGLPEQDWLYWYDEQGSPYPSQNELIEQIAAQAEAQTRQAEAQAKQAEARARQAEQIAEQERRLREELMQKLRDRGIDPNTL